MPLQGNGRTNRSIIALFLIIIYDTQFENKIFKNVKHDFDTCKYYF